MKEKRRKAERKETTGKGEERTSISGHHATGNAHQRVTQKKPKRKCPIQKGGKNDKRMENTVRKERISNGDKAHQYVSITAWRLFVVFVVPLLACNIANTESQNGGYCAV